MPRIGHQLSAQVNESFDPGRGFGSFLLPVWSERQLNELNDPVEKITSCLRHFQVATQSVGGLDRESAHQNVAQRASERHFEDEKAVGASSDSFVARATS